MDLSYGPRYEAFREEIRAFLAEHAHGQPPEVARTPEFVIPEEGPLLACHVKAHLAEVGQRVARTAIEVHGGMGFTDLLGLPYWFKRIGVNRQALGGPEQLREEAARLQGWIPSA